MSCIEHDRSLNAIVEIAVASETTQGRVFANRRVDWVFSDPGDALLVGHKSHERSVSKKAFVSEEKKQKTFMSLSRFSPAAHARSQRFFGSFFQKRTSCLLLSRSTSGFRHKPYMLSRKHHEC
jgi:hypothetical protein